MLWAGTVAAEAWKESHPDFATWRRLKALMAGVPRWELWWRRMCLHRGEQARKVLPELTAVDDAFWAAAEVSKALWAHQKGPARAVTPLSMAREFAAAHGGGGSGGDGAGGKR
jgi:hypothetical protein